MSKIAIIIFLYKGINLFISFTNLNTVIFGLEEKKFNTDSDNILFLPRSLFCLYTKVKLYFFKIFPSKYKKNLNLNQIISTIII